MQLWSRRAARRAAGAAGGRRTECGAGTDREYDPKKKKIHRHRRTLHRPQQPQASTMAEHKPSKSAGDGDRDKAVTVKINKAYAPLLASYAGVSAPEGTVAQGYKRKRSVVLHAETERIEYNGQNEPDQDVYYVGLYDAKKGTVELAHAPLVTVARTIKANKPKRLVAIKQLNVEARLQRNNLGEEFGTKKAKRAIGDLERNAIEADKLESFTDSIVDNITTSTENLPSKEDVKEAEDEERPIPACNEDATIVENIFPIDSLLSKKEQSAIKLGYVIREADEKKKVASFPFKTSGYINTRVAGIHSDEHLLKLKLLYYASLLMGLYNNRRTSNKKMLAQKLNHPADVLLDGLIERFTQPRASGVGKNKEAAFLMTPKQEDKLLCFLFTTCLWIDDFTVETQVLATELSLKPTRVQELFRTLGARVKACTAAQRDALGLTNAEAANYRLASLALPFKLPEVAKRRRRAR
ncbi:A49-like RNA polymerase I associated factor-domain-containing protein [Dipodascopsis tothii]|uniref:A49-like RNA polymerase I associated factor-domain-containing protein n=1 Tax=Dipodascopsis tothii TaxID=44089 RepID=UPI0034CD5F71